jgi:hypothetical protein
MRIGPAVASDSMKNIPLFVFTRLGIGVSNESYYERVLPLFEAVTFPSMMGQTDSDFHWMIAVDASMPPKARDRLLQLVADRSQIHIVPVEMIELQEMHIGSFNWLEQAFCRFALSKGLIERADDFIITALIDCDDAWHESTVAIVRTNALQLLPSLILSEENKFYLAAGIAGAVMTFPNGYEWHPLAGTSVHLRYPWLSMSIFVVSRFCAGVYAFSCRHDCWPQMAQIATFLAAEMNVSSPMWIHTRHGDNLSAAFGVGKREIIPGTSHLKSFHIDETALARWHESLPANKAAERPEKHRVAFKQYALMFKIAAFNKQIDCLRAAMATGCSAKLDDILKQAINSRQALLNEYSATSKLI